MQGVGFRFTVRMLASRFEVTGFVRNLADGRVHLVAEGAADQLARFLAAVRGEMGRYIVDAQESERPAEGRFREFTVRH